MGKFLRSSALAAVVVSAGLALPGVALAAAPPAKEHVTNDERAVVVEKNATAADCAQLWPGSAAVELDATIAEKTYLTINSIPAGVQVVGVVVKGSSAYNRYEAARLGTPPWNRLESPVAGNSGEAAEISHWFACGVRVTAPGESEQPEESESEQPTSPAEESSAPAGSSAPAESSAPAGESSSAAPASSGAPVTTTAAPAAVAGNDGDLADTGANPGWALLAGLLLVLGGGVTLLSPKVRAALGKR